MMLKFIEMYAKPITSRCISKCETPECDSSRKGNTAPSL
jgi:hypothetical protein